MWVPTTNGYWKRATSTSTWATSSWHTAAPPPISGTVPTADHQQASILNKPAGKYPGRLLFLNRKSYINTRKKIHTRPTQTSIFASVLSSPAPALQPQYRQACEQQ